MKAYRGVEAQFRSLLTSALQGAWWSASCSCRFTPTKKVPVSSEKEAGLAPEPVRRLWSRQKSSSLVAIPNTLSWYPLNLVELHVQTTNCFGSSTCFCSMRLRIESDWMVSCHHTIRINPLVCYWLGRAASPDETRGLGVSRLATSYGRSDGITDDREVSKEYYVHAEFHEL
jgi:hypothetical protein